MRRASARLSAARRHRRRLSRPQTPALRPTLPPPRLALCVAGECWLKNQRDPSRPEAGAYGAYPDGYRKKHHTAPPQVQWMSGSLAKTKLTVDGPKWHW